MNIIELGFGKVVVNAGRYNGKAALFIEPAPVPGVAGGDASNSGLDRDSAGPNATVITFENPGCLDALRDELKLVHLVMP